MTSKIEQQVMAGVGILYVARRATSRTALELYMLALSACGVIFFVSLPHVFVNLMHVESGGLLSVAAFVLAAVLGTSLVVQLALLIGSFSLVSLGVHTLRPVSRAPTLATR